MVCDHPYMRNEENASGQLFSTGGFGCKFRTELIEATSVFLIGIINEGVTGRVQGPFACQK